MHAHALISTTLPAGARAARSMLAEARRASLHESRTHLAQRFELSTNSWHLAPQASCQIEKLASHGCVRAGNTSNGGG